MMQRFGPVLQVQINLPKHLSDQYAKDQKTIPPSVNGIALVDTGASLCCVDSAVVTQLGVLPVGLQKVSTPSGTEDQLVYPVLINCAEGPFFFNTNTALASDHLLKNQGIIALLGRDLLAHTILIYDGRRGSFTIAW
ncbi:MAG TPA: hypothetical protein VNN55_02485 [bacterium]|nr:hypothetical protein [bacterium]